MRHTAPLVCLSNQMDGTTMDEFCSEMNTPATVAASSEISTVAAASAAASAAMVRAVTARRQKQRLLLEQVLAQLLTEVVKYLDARSTVRFVGLFARAAGRASDGLVDPAFRPPIQFRRDLLRMALQHTDIEFTTSMAKDLHFTPKTVTLRAISKAFDGLTKLQPEQPPKSGLLSAAELCERVMAKIRVPMRLITGAAQSHSATLMLPCNRCTAVRMYKINGETPPRRGPCGIAKFYTCSSSEELCHECREHSMECDECGERVCADCVELGWSSLDYDEDYDPSLRLCSMCRGY